MLCQGGLFIFQVLTFCFYYLQMKLALEKRNTIGYVHNLMKDFYSQRKQFLKFKKYKLLQRWARYSEKVQQLDRTEALLHARINKLDKEFQFISPKLQELTDLHISDHMSKSVLGNRDFACFIRSMVYDVVTKKRLDRFYAKLNWVAHTDRMEYLKKAVSSYTQVITYLNTIIV